jgi:hypothetical protein
MTTDKSRADAPTDEHIVHAFDLSGVDFPRDRANVNRLIAAVRAVLAASPIEQPAAAPCKHCGATTAQACNDKGCFYLESGDGEPTVPSKAGERAAWEKVLHWSKYIKSRLDTKEAVNSSISGPACDAGERAVWMESLAREMLARAASANETGAEDELIERLKLLLSGDAAFCRTSVARSAIERAIAILSRAPAQATEPDAIVRDNPDDIGTIIEATRPLAIGTKLYAAPQPRAQADARDDTHQFKNFHRRLCERFDYVHDEIDWRRDQVSLIEWIAKKVNARDGLTDEHAFALYTLARTTDDSERWIKELRASITAHPGQPEPRAEVTDDDKVCAARYRWLSRQAVATHSYDELDCRWEVDYVLRGESFDAAVDAARAGGDHADQA